MKAPLRIVIPILLAVVMTIMIGGLFLWQINISVRTIESSFRNEKSVGILDRILPGRNTVSERTPENQSQALTTLRQGEVFEMRGEWKQAEEKYSESVDKGGGVPALRKLATMQLQRREYADAKTTIATLQREVNDRRSIMLLEGLLALRSGKTSEAATIFNRNPETPEGLYGLSLVAINSGDHTKAKELLSRAVQGSDTTIRAYADTILRAYQEFALFPDGQDTHLKTLLAHALAESGECESALTLVTRVVSEQSRYRDAWIVKGYCEFATERLKDALTSLEQAYSLDPEKAETQYFLARTHAALGDPQNAVTFLQYAILNGFQPERDARSLLADYAKELGNTELALEQLKVIASAEGSTLDDVVRYTNLALSVQNHAVDALTLSKVAVGKWPNDAHALALAAKTALAAGLPDDSKKYLEQAEKISPTDPYVKEARAVVERGMTTK